MQSLPSMHPLLNPSRRGQLIDGLPFAYSSPTALPSPKASLYFLRVLRTKAQSRLP